MNEEGKEVGLVIKEGKEEGKEEVREDVREEGK